MDKLLGTRLKRAREEINLSQGAFAKSLGLSSEYISLLESGKRTPSFETLLKVAGFLNKNVSYFFEDLRPAFERPVRPGGDRRKGPQGPPEVPGHLRKIPRARGGRPAAASTSPRATPASPPSGWPRRSGAGSGSATSPSATSWPSARSTAAASSARSLAEEARIAGIFVFDEERKAAFALINANEPPGFQTLIAAHLYGHYLMDRDDSPIVDNPDVVVDEYVSLYPPREQFAQTFASRFLVPPGKLLELIEKDIRAKSLAFDDVLFLKRYFGVSTRAMLRTLRGLGILPEAKFEEFFKRNPEDREEEVFGGLSGQEERRARTLFRKSRTIPSDRFRLLAAEAAAAEKARAGNPPPPPKTGGSDE